MSSEKQAIIVTDLTYGDAGKGSVVDYLAREHSAHTVVRFNGGAQAAHNVVTPEGKHHTFAQFGSGTFVPGTKTQLSRFMMVNPLAMIGEEKRLQGLGITDAFKRITIDREALITTPFHIAANRLREMARGMSRHGSCGMGIGETMSAFLDFGDQVILAKDLLNPVTLAKKLQFLKDIKWESLQEIIATLPDSDQAKRELNVFADPCLIQTCVEVYEYFVNQLQIVDENFWKQTLDRSGTILFEGAQGVLLDERYGFHPYTTWSTTTFKNALILLEEAGYKEQVTKLGLFRGYTTRHGAGPFATEDIELTKKIPDHHNGMNDWQRQFRVGFFDLVAAKYALDVSPPDVLGFTCLDRLVGIPDWKIALSYDFLGTKIAKLEVKKDPLDMVFQERLTNRLLQSFPDYYSFDPAHFNSPREALSKYLEILAADLKTPIGLWSLGPTARDKITVF